MLSVAAYFKVNKGRGWSLSQKETTAYEVTVYIFTWRKEKHDCSKSLGMEKWAASLSPSPSLFVPLTLSTSNRGNICGIHFWECYNSSQWLEPVQYARQCLMWPWSPFSDCCASSTPPACALSNAMQAGLSKLSPSPEPRFPGEHFKEWWFPEISLKERTHETDPSLWAFFDPE